MTKSHLVACATCARHVRASEAACPFCSACLSPSLREAAPPRPPTTRLGRAALLALGTGAAAIANACGGEVVGDGTHMVTDGGGDDGGTSADGAMYDGMSVALYGGISPEEAGCCPPYGHPPPPPDAGDVPDASVPIDASSVPPQDGGAMPPYGQPPAPPPPPDEDAGD